MAAATSMSSSLVAVAPSFPLIITNGLYSQIKESMKKC